MESSFHQRWFAVPCENGRLRLEQWSAWLKVGLRSTVQGRTLLTLTSIACLVLVSPFLMAQGAPSGGTVWDGVFTDTQASRGEAAYGRSCAACHKEDLLGDGTAPALAGDAFFRRWNEGTLDDVVQTMRSSMPQEAPNSLAAQAYVDIITYLLKASGTPTGAVELTSDRDRLKLVRVTPPPR
jgi:mono/diheme cytochrome c family protein